MLMGVFLFAVIYLPDLFGINAGNPDKFCFFLFNTLEKQLKKAILRA